MFETKVTPTVDKKDKDIKIGPFQLFFPQRN